MFTAIGQFFKKNLPLQITSVEQGKTNALRIQESLSSRPLMSVSSKYSPSLPANASNLKEWERAKLIVPLSELTSKQQKSIVHMMSKNVPLPSHFKPLNKTVFPPFGATKFLTVPLRKKGGRNHTGRITCRHRGGGYKRRIRILDTVRNFTCPHEVIRIEHDPNRSAKIALIRNSDNQELSYILASVNMKPGFIIDSKQRKEGATLKLSDIPIGEKIHNISRNMRSRGSLVRSAGTYATVSSWDTDGNCIVKMPSGALKSFSKNSTAVLGQVGNIEKRFQQIGKAGRKRNLGWRPTVRGVAMNPVDHPHGGGKGGRSKGHHSQSPWGKICK